MIEIIICLIIWCWGLTPLWVNIIASILLFIRFSWRVMLTMCKIFKWNESFEEKKECDTDGIVLEEEGSQNRIEKDGIGN